MVTFGGGFELGGPGSHCVQAVAPGGAGELVGRGDDERDGVDREVGAASAGVIHDATHGVHLLVEAAPELCAKRFELGLELILPSHRSAERQFVDRGRDSRLTAGT